MSKFVEVLVVISDNISELDGKLSDAIAYLQNKLDKIPLEYMHSAVFNTVTHSDYNYPSCEFSISYYRPETIEEENIRLSRAQFQDDTLRQRELAQLKLLKQKYGDIE